VCGSAGERSDLSADWSAEALAKAEASSYALRASEDRLAKAGNHTLDLGLRLRW
jgi:hypothetical protein